MTSIERSFGVSAARGFAAVAVMVGAFGLTASNLQATPEPPADAAAQVHALPDSFRGCVAEGRTAKRFEVQRKEGGIRTIDFCNTGDRGDLPATALALSVAMDAATPRSGITSDPRTLDILGLRMRRARTEMNTGIDLDARNRKLTEIDGAIKRLEDEISRAR